MSVLQDIKLFINSPGGSVTAGMGIYDAMQVRCPLACLQHRRSVLVACLQLCLLLLAVRIIALPSGLSACNAKCSVELEHMFTEFWSLSNTGAHLLVGRSCLIRVFALYN